MYNDGVPVYYGNFVFECALKSIRCFLHNAQSFFVCVPPQRSHFTSCSLNFTAFSTAKCFKTRTQYVHYAQSVSQHIQRKCHKIALYFKTKCVFYFASAFRTEPQPTSDYLQWNPTFRFVRSFCRFFMITNVLCASFYLFMTTLCCSTVSLGANKISLLLWCLFSFTVVFILFHFCFGFMTGYH